MRTSCKHLRGHLLATDAKDVIFLSPFYRIAQHQFSLCCSAQIQNDTGQTQKATFATSPFRARKKREIQTSSQNVFWCSVRVVSSWMCFLISAILLASTSSAKGSVTPMAPEQRRRRVRACTLSGLALLLVCVLHCSQLASVIRIMDKRTRLSDLSRLLKGSH